MPRCSRTVQTREVGRHLGHRFGRQRHQPHRDRQRVVAEQRLEDVGDDAVRVEVAHLGRIEAGLGGLEQDAQHVGVERDVAVVRRRRRACGGDEAGAADSEPAAIDAARHGLRPSLLRADGRAVVDVDELPPVLPEHRAAVADHALLRHVERQPVEDVLVRHVGEGDALGLAEDGDPLGAVGQRLQLVVEHVELRQPDARHVLAADLLAVVALERALRVGPMPTGRRPATPGSCRRARTSGSPAIGRS